MANTKGKQRTGGAGSVQRMVRGCQWMMKARQWNDCGEPETHMHRGSKMVFCTRHALEIAAVGMDMVELSPNIPKVSHD